jgi:hypothetical protein
MPRDPLSLLVCSTSSPQSTGLLHLVPSVFWSAQPRPLPPPRASSTLPVKLGLQLPQPLQVRSSPRPLRQPMHRGLVLTAARRREAPQRGAAEGRRRGTPQRDAAERRRRREAPHNSANQSALELIALSTELKDSAERRRMARRVDRGGAAHALVRRSFWIDRFTTICERFICT